MSKRIYKIDETELTEEEYEVLVDSLAAFYHKKNKSNGELVNRVIAKLKLYEKIWEKTSKV